MKKKRFSVEQITSVLQQADGGVPVSDVWRQVAISEQTFYRWKKVYGKMLPGEVRERGPLKRGRIFFVREGTGAGNDAMAY